MRLLSTLSLLLSTLSAGMMAGLFAGFAYAVMPGLRGSADRTLVEAMQRINVAIVNPVFMSAFMGASRSPWLPWPCTGAATCGRCCRG